MLAAMILGFFLQTTTIEIADKELKVEIADTQKTRAQGLSGRKSLSEGEGMLFVFKKPTILSFYMKDTEIPLSIGFFDEEKVLIDMKDMDPFPASVSTIPIFRSALPAQYALEVPQGWFRKNGIAPGTKFAFKKPSSQVK